MKTKEIAIGCFYELCSMKHSRLGASKEYFTHLQGEQVLVTKKLNNYGNKNTVRVQGLVQKKDQYIGVSFWCSPYDLKLLLKEQV